ncbi:hypothetical protein NW759_016852 [Fusarium solani]|nr:hypothetical protein NW759_016852 [Fusarium solani]
MASSLGLDCTTFHNIIGGKLVSTKQTRHSVNPSTLEPNPEVPVSSREDVDRAVAVAQEAVGTWAGMRLADRQQAVRRLADALGELTDSFATLLVKEQGKPLQMARFEIHESVQILKGIADLPFSEEVTVDTDSYRAVKRYVPIGVAVGIVPWNFPIYLACFKIASALVTGNVLILKPSPFTPYSGLKIVELGQRVFPPGVLQALCGDDDLGPWLTSHPGIGKVSFTGSVATGKRVMESCSKTLKRVTLELGGNDPAIVCDDVDILAVAPKIAKLALMNSGQICIAIKRIYVHSSIYDELVAEIAAVAQNLPVGDGFQEGVFLGPVQNSLQYDRVRNLLADIQNKSLKIATNGAAQSATPNKGYFIMPTIVDNPPDDSRIVVEEPFGPVFPVLKWTYEDDVICRANHSTMGLGASVWSKDLERANRIAKRLEAGNVWINTHSELYASSPFSGFKESGLGTELGVEGLTSYCYVQNVHVNKDV